MQITISKGINMETEEIIAELKVIRKQCQRQFKRSEDSVNYYTESEERLSMHGHWAKGYFEGKCSAYDNVIGRLDGLINKYESNDTKDNKEYYYSYFKSIN